MIEGQKLFQSNDFGQKGVWATSVYMIEENLIYESDSFGNNKGVWAPPVFVILSE